MPDLSPAEVAKQLGVSRNAVYRAIDSGELEAYKFRGRLRVSPEAVERMKQENGVRPRRPASPSPMFEPRPSKGEDSFLERLRRRERGD